MKNTQIEREHGQNENVETNPERQVCLHQEIISRMQGRLLQIHF
jgi:hypothetical protein